LRHATKIIRDIRLNHQSRKYVVLVANNAEKHLKQSIFKIFDASETEAAGLAQVY